jgi:hypothetical protein
MTSRSTHHTTVNSKCAQAFKVAVDNGSRIHQLTVCYLVPGNGTTGTRGLPVEEYWGSLPGLPPALSRSRCPHDSTRRTAEWSHPAHNIATTQRPAETITPTLGHAAFSEPQGRHAPPPTRHPHALTGVPMFTSARTPSSAFTMLSWLPFTATSRGVDPS